MGRIRTGLAAALLSVAVTNPGNYRMVVCAAAEKPLAAGAEVTVVREDGIRKVRRVIAPGAKAGSESSTCRWTTSANTPRGASSSPSLSPIRSGCRPTGFIRCAAASRRWRCTWIILSLAGVVVPSAVARFLDLSGHEYRWIYPIGSGLAMLTAIAGIACYRRFLAYGGPAAYQAPEA